MHTTKKMVSRVLLCVAALCASCTAAVYRPTPFGPVTEHHYDQAPIAVCHRYFEWVRCRLLTIFRSHLPYP